MNLFSKRLVAALALVAAGTFATRLALAGEEVSKPAAPVAGTPEAKAAPAEAPKTVEAPATKTPSPMHTLLGYVAKQVAPNLECPCPAKAEGEQAWRGWFAGGADVPMAGLRDSLVADGWTADRFVGFFQKMAKGCSDCPGESKDAASADGAKGDCAKADCAKAGKAGCCEGKGENADGKPCCGKCKKDESEAKPAAGTTAPVETAKP